jgi:putative copper resistance protein D
VDYALVLSRTLHFAATVSASGVVFFRAFVANADAWPCDHNVSRGGLREFYRRLDLVFWISLVLALASGAVWFLLVAVDIADRPVSEVFTDDVAWTVLSETQFGHVWTFRLLLGTLLAATAGLANPETNWRWQIEVPLAAGFLGSLAWAGHAGGTPGLGGTIHIVSDILHLIAAGAWVGGLLPFASLLKTIRRVPEADWGPVANAATRRFSTLGLAAVGTILATGIVNTWNLVGSRDALIDTDYGRLLMLKAVLFAAMISIAAFNRMRLSPKLASAGTIRKLERNSLIEALLGLTILFIVGALGIVAPAIHSHAGHIN